MADAYNASTPVNGEPARFGAEEVRALKARMDAMTGVNLSGMFAFRNRAVNPEFKFDQEREGGTYTAIGQVKDLDGWSHTSTGSGLLYAKRNIESDGRSNARLITVNTADAVLAAADVYASWTVLEGLMCDDFRQGQADATGFTVSFKATASIAGNYGIAFKNAAQTRSYVTTFNIAVAGTEQQIVVNVPGDTTGTWLYDTGVGLFCFLDHGSGSTLVAPTLNEWIAGNYNAAAGAIQMISTVGATFKTKEFQWEKGQIASPTFEFIPYNQQLEYLQRYAEKSYLMGVAVATAATFGGSATTMTGTGAINSVYIGLDYRTRKRLAPTVSTYNPRTGAAGQLDDSGATASAVTMAASGDTRATFYNSGGAVSANAIAYMHWYANARLS